MVLGQVLDPKITLKDLGALTREKSLKLCMESNFQNLHKATSPKGIPFGMVVQTYTNSSPGSVFENYYFREERKEKIKTSFGKLSKDYR